MKALHRRSDGSYTMRDVEHGVSIPLAHPPKFSLDDRLARFRYEQMKARWESER